MRLRGMWKTVASEENQVYLEESIDTKNKLNTMKIPLRNVAFLLSRTLIGCADDGEIEKKIFSKDV